MYKKDISSVSIYITGVVILKEIVIFKTKLLKIYYWSE